MVALFNGMMDGIAIAQFGDMLDNFVVRMDDYMFQYTHIKETA